MRRGPEGLLGRRAARGPALHPVPKGPRQQCPHGAPTFVLPFSVYEVLSSSFISFLPHHSPRRGLGVPVSRLGQEAGPRSAEPGLLPALGGDRGRGLAPS